MHAFMRQPPSYCFWGPSHHRQLIRLCGYNDPNPNDCCAGILWIDAPVNFFWHMFLLRKSYNDSMVCILGPPTAVMMYQDIMHAAVGGDLEHKLQVLRAIGCVVQVKKQFHPNILLMALFTGKGAIGQEESHAIEDAGASLMDQELFLEKLAAEQDHECQVALLRVVVLCSILNGKLHFRDEFKLIRKAVAVVVDVELIWRQVENMVYDFKNGNGVLVEDLNYSLGLDKESKPIAIADDSKKHLSNKRISVMMNSTLDFLDNPLDGTLDGLQAARNAARKTKKEARRAGLQAGKSMDRLKSLQITPKQSNRQLPPDESV